jgi:hypothetical protein
MPPRKPDKDGAAGSLSLPGDPFTTLFRESAARAVVSVQPGREPEFPALKLNEF